MASLVEILEHLHGTEKVYPQNSYGTLLTSPASVWGEGAYTVVIPANTITVPFDITKVNLTVSGFSGTIGCVRLYSGADGDEVLIAEVAVQPAGIGEFIISTPKITANAQIKATLACDSETSKTGYVVLSYHEHSA